MILLFLMSFFFVSDSFAGNDGLHKINDSSTAEMIYAVDVTDLESIYDFSDANAETFNSVTYAATDTHITGLTIGTYTDATVYIRLDSSNWKIAVDLDGDGTYDTEDYAEDATGSSTIKAAVEALDTGSTNTALETAILGAMSHNLTEGEMVTGQGDKVDLATDAELALVDTKATTNQTNIATNTTNIQANTTNITTNTTDVTSLKSSMTDIQTDVAMLKTTVTNISRELKGGIAAALAADNVAYSTYDGWSVSGGFGQYDTESAFAIGASYRQQTYAARFAYTKDNNAQGFSAGFQWEI